VTVALRPMERMPLEVPLLACVKLLVHPILVLALLAWFGPFGEVWVDTALLMAALPPALSAYVFARQYDTWIEQASGVVLIGTLLSVATLTAVMWLVQTKTLSPLLAHIGICLPCG
jgi:malonate transporter and related proteins